jgi:hypothetical protein
MSWDLKKFRPQPKAPPMNSSDGEITPEEVARAVIQELTQSGRWEEVRVRLASILEASGAYMQAKRRTQQILNSDQLQTKLRQASATPGAMARMVKKHGGLQGYRTELAQLLTPDSPIGQELQRELGLLIDRYLDDHLSH